MMQGLACTAQVSTVLKKGNDSFNIKMRNATGLEVATTYYIFKKTPHNGGSIWLSNANATLQAVTKNKGIYTLVLGDVAQVPDFYINCVNAPPTYEAHRMTVAFQFQEFHCVSYSSPIVHIFEQQHRTENNEACHGNDSSGSTSKTGSDSPCSDSSGSTSKTGSESGTSLFGSAKQIELSEDELVTVTQEDETGLIANQEHGLDSNLNCLLASPNVEDTTDSTSGLFTNLPDNQNGPQQTGKRGCPEPKVGAPPKKMRITIKREPDRVSLETVGGGGDDVIEPSDPHQDLTDGAAACFQWDTEILAKLQQMCLGGELDFLHTLADRFGITKMSTSFSGIDSPHVATKCLAHKLQALLPNRRVSDGLRPLWSCEIDKACREELLVMPGAEYMCCFGDINDFWHALIRQKAVLLMKRSHTALEILNGLLEKANANTMTRTAYCWKHKRPCTAQVADIHIAGTPCPAYSTLGKGAKVHDKTIVPTMAWVGMRLMLQEAIWIQENVPGFIEDTLIESLGHLYWIEISQSQNKDLGWPTSRSRQWIIGRHKQKTVRQVYYDLCMKILINY